MSTLITELKRRNVLRVAAAYLVASWLILQVVDVTFPMLGIDESLGVPLLVLLVLGAEVHANRRVVNEQTVLRLGVVSQCLPMVAGDDAAAVLGPYGVSAVLTDVRGDHELIGAAVAMAV